MNSPTSNPWRISFQAWAALLGLGLALWLIITNWGLLVEIAIVLFFVALFTMALRPAVTYLTIRRIPAAITLLVIYAAILGIFVLVGNLLVPAVASEVSFFSQHGPALLQQAITQIQAIPILGKFIGSSDTLVQNLVQQVDMIIRPLLTTITGIGGLAINVIIVLVLTFFFLVGDRHPSTHFIETWIPERFQAEAYEILGRISGRLTRWVWAQASIAVYFMIAFSIGLLLLRVPFALTIGIVGGLLEIVPYLGGIIGTILALISALSISPVLALWVVLLYIVIVEVESHVITPIFFGRVMGLHAAIVLVMLLVGARIAGTLGVVLAVPVTVVVDSVYQELVRSRQSKTESTS
jgi:predicted PurR-regulated permease PerM